MATLIDIEGVDGAGKGTQARRLCDRVRDAGFSCELVGFPRYDATWFGRAAGRFLNGELSARLDDARALLGQRGGTASASNDVDPEPTGPRTLPAGRSTRKARKPPFAQIPGRIDSVPGNDSSGLDDDGPSPSVNGSWRGDPGPQSSRSDPTLWLPVARGTSEPSPPRR